MSVEIAAANAFLRKHGVTHVPAGKFNAASKELGVDFSQLLYLLGLLYDGPQSRAAQRAAILDAEKAKLVGQPARATK